MDIVKIYLFFKLWNAPRLTWQLPVHSSSSLVTLLPVSLSTASSTEAELAAGWPRLAILFWPSIT